MKKFRTIFFILLWQIAVCLLVGNTQAQKPLNGIRCDIEPAKRVDSFKMPVLPVGNKTWQVTNDFGNRVTNKDVPGLPNGVWQHTGADYLLGGSSAASQNQSIYTAANGVVVFSTASNPNPVPARGGLIIIRHLAPKGSKFTVVRYNGKAGVYEAFETEEIYTYYLHLDPAKILVQTGENVEAGRQIAQTYNSKDVGKGKKYVYVPHLHFEVWSACSKTELNGYETDGDLKKSLRKPVIDPISFLSNAKIVGGTTPNPLPTAVKAAELPTMFLLDVSDSMNENDKIGQAKGAGLNAVRQMQENRRRGQDNSSVAVWLFGGDCSPNNIRQISPFSPNLTQAETTFRSRIPKPAGLTPLYTAVDISVENMLNYLSARPALREGRIIVLSDGINTCGDRIRPRGVYSQSAKIVYQQIRFLTIGYDIQAGSQAERDLQYLASVSGGKYFPAGNNEQLSRAFEKAIRIYLPKTAAGASVEFERGVEAILNRNFSAALQIFTIYVQANPSDALGFYNLAVACEAAELYKSAAENYRKYLELAPETADANEVRVRIGKMEEDYRAKLFYYANLLRSDLEYLKAYYQKLFSGQKNAELAAEFAGFVSEKGSFYKSLPQILEINPMWLKRGSEELTDSLGRLNSRARLPSFDRDAVSLLTAPIGELKDLVEKLDEYNAQIFR